MTLNVIDSSNDAQAETVLPTSERTPAHNLDLHLTTMLFLSLVKLDFFKQKHTLIVPEKQGELPGGIGERYRRWLKESIRQLCKFHFLQPDRLQGTDIGRLQRYNLTPLGREVAADAQAKYAETMHSLAKFGEFSDQITLASSAMAVLPDILRGAIPATDILFPSSSVGSVATVYKGNPIADYFNQALADIITAYVQQRLQRDANAKINILEIGAGTGGVSARIFKELSAYKDNIGEYCYTDVSKAFLLHAEEAYGSLAPYLRYKILNIESDPVVQGIEPAAYDIVVACNVLHATKNIRRTLQHCKITLKPSGILLLNEIAESSLFTHLTFGLLEGWWRYEDEELRIPGCPGLYPERWEKVLKQEGFENVAFPVEHAHKFGTQIVFAESDGTIVRQLTKPTAELIQQPRQLSDQAEPVNTLLKKTVKTIRKIKQVRPATQMGAVLNREQLRTYGMEYLKHMIGQVLKISSADIQDDESLESYGVDSIFSVQLAEQLAQSFSDISSTLFFEFPTVAGLCDHLINTQAKALSNMLGIIDVTDETTDAAAAEVLEEYIEVLPTETSTQNDLSALDWGDVLTTTVPGLAQQRKDIAIIGISGRYPMADSLDEFWQNLLQGKDCITEVPQSRWDYQRFFDEGRAPGTSYCKWGGFLNDIECFDPLLFNISPNEAAVMDPQVRLMLQNIWELLEVSGYSRDRLNEELDANVGVYLSAMYHQYQQLASDIVSEAAVSISSYSSMANRVSYFFNLRGPSIAIDTMCSGSFVAIHMASQAILNNDCRAAIAGSINLTLHPKKYIGLSLMQMMASSANIRSFGEGDGFLPAEGIGVVMLKPLQSALRDGDRIEAVIKSSTVNHNGRGSGYSTPSLATQEALISSNIEKSGVDPRTISYVESSATGSALADSIEFNALNKAFRKYTQDTQFCAIGSVKSNIGHAEAASGMSQLSKVILQMRHKMLVPSILSQPANLNIHFGQSPFYLQNQCSEWPRPKHYVNGQLTEVPRRAAISSFGAGGTNVHLIVEEAPEVSTFNSVQSGGRQIFIFSGRNKVALTRVLEQMVAFMQGRDNLALNELAYTLQVAREALDVRLAIVASSLQQLQAALERALTALHNEQSISGAGLFYGEKSQSSPSASSMLSGSSGKQILALLLQQREWDKIALYWCEGGKIPWYGLYADQPRPRIMVLPTYPFAKRRCWLSAEAGEKNKPQTISAKPMQYSDSAVLNIASEVKNIFCSALGLSPMELDIYKPIRDYGVDSVIAIQLVLQLKDISNDHIDVDAFEALHTVADFIKEITKYQPSPRVIDNGGPAKPDQSKSPTMPTSARRSFPELVKFNRATGAPVFWIHAATGGVELYAALAKRANRPFYGIQARGYENQDEPIKGISEIAKYYADVIMSMPTIQPIDLGGFSIGGLLAYETLRELQKRERKVSSLVMVDTLATVSNMKVSYKTRYLQEVNTELSTEFAQKARKNILVVLKYLLSRNKMKHLIHRNDVDSKLSDEQYLNTLLTLALGRGMQKSEAQIKKQIDVRQRIISAYDIGDDFIIQPLPDDRATKCYYFKNASRTLLGNYEPYFAIAEDVFSVGDADYWSEWRRYFKHFEMITVNSSNHINMLSERKSLNKILQFTKSLYQ